ncbi:MAG: hypothetical protein R2783_02115 [Gelidibacter sp.]
MTDFTVVYFEALIDEIPNARKSTLEYQKTILDRTYKNESRNVGTEFAISVGTMCSLRYTKSSG